MKKKKYTRRKQTHLNKVLAEADKNLSQDKNAVISFESHPQYMASVLNAIAKDMEESMQKAKK